MDKCIKREFDLIGFGEVMLRLSPPDKERISQSQVFEKMAGGSELNVVSGASLLGCRTGIVTKLPDNIMGGFAKNKVRYYGVSDDYIVFDKSKNARLGVYYYESGAYPRKPTVIYDRIDSSICSISLDEIKDDIFKSTNVFHVSGITLALSENTKNTAIEMIKRFKKENVTVSFDVNFRANLWTEEEARKTILEILPYIDILFISEETFRRMMQMKGELKDIIRRFSLEHDVKLIASSKREVINPSFHNFTSILYDKKSDEFFSEPAYERIQVVDRIGSGDAFVAGTLFGYIKCNSLQKALEFGNAMAAVKNTVPGDMPACDYDEIVRVINTHKGLGNNSEMNR